MDHPLKTNRLALISFISGLIALLSISLIFLLYRTVELGGTLLTLADGALIPLRNLSVVVALITGILGLMDIKKKAGAERGKTLAWVGIILSAGWILFGILVGTVFLVSAILQ